MRTPGGVEREAGLLVVGGHPARADAELEPAVGEQVDRRRLVGEHDRVLVVVAEHERADPQRRRSTAAAAMIAGIGASGWSTKWSGTKNVEKPRASAWRARSRELGRRAAPAWRCTPKRNLRSCVIAATSSAGAPEAERCRASVSSSSSTSSHSTYSTRWITSCAMRSPRCDVEVLVGSRLTSSTFSSSRYCGSMRPGAFEHDDAVLHREARARQHEARVARRDRDRDAGRHQRPAAAGRERARRRGRTRS